MHYTYMQHEWISHLILVFRRYFFLPSCHFISNWRSSTRTRCLIHKEASHQVHPNCRRWTEMSLQMIIS